jgi:hypothetical protein
MADWQTQRIAQALLGPREGKLTPENEAGYQAFMAFDPSVRQWRNGFQAKYGEVPNTASDPSFNYREAYTQGNVPQMYAGDNSMHWDSRGKAPDHPTAWMNDFMGQYGVDPVLQAQQGTLTPPQQQTINGQLSNDLLAQLLQGNR